MGTIKGFKKTRTVNNDSYWYVLAFVVWILVAYFSLSGFPNTSYGDAEEYEVRDCGTSRCSS